MFGMGRDIDIMGLYSQSSVLLLLSSIVCFGYRTKTIDSSLDSSIIASIRTLSIVLTSLKEVGDRND